MATAEARVVYLDASAIVKLVVRESETDALRAYLEGAQLVSSEVALTEVPRAAHLRTGAPEVFEQADAVLRRFDLVALDEELHRAAARAEPRELRTLDAIHLASAVRVRDRLAGVVAYDKRLTQAVRAVGLTVDAPGSALAPIDTAPPSTVGPPPGS